MRLETLRDDGLTDDVVRALDSAMEDEEWTTVGAGWSVLVLFDGRLLCKRGDDVVILG